MHFVDGKGGFPWIDLGQERRGAPPCTQGMNNGGIARGRLALEGKRIALFPQYAVGAQNPVFVFLTNPCVWNEQFPTSGEPRASWEENADSMN